MADCLWLGSWGRARRGAAATTGSLFCDIDLEKRGRADHRLRLIREIANAALKSLSRDFAALDWPLGRGSIPPERLLWALLLQAFPSIRSARQWGERIDPDLLFRWFVGLGIAGPVWRATPFPRNRDRRLDGAIAGKFLAAMRADKRVKELLSRAPFPVAGSLLEAWASPRSLGPKDGSGEPPGPGRNGAHNLRGDQRKNDTRPRDPRPRRATVPQQPAPAKAGGPGKKARLCFRGPTPRENRSGLSVEAVTTRASGHAERLAIAPIEPRADRPNPITRGADKAHDTAEFGREGRECAVTPPVAQNRSGQRSALDRRTTRPPGHALSQPIRKRIETAFGGAKTVAGPRNMRPRSPPKPGWHFTLAMAADNLVRWPKLRAAPAP